MCLITDILSGLQINAETNAQRPVLRIEIPRKLTPEEEAAAKQKPKGIETHYLLHTSS